MPQVINTDFKLGHYLKLGIALILVGALLVLTAVAQRRRRALKPMTEQECLTWLHNNGFADGYSAMLSQAQRNPPRLTLQCVEVANKEIQRHADEMVASGRYTLPGGSAMVSMEIARHQWFLTTRSVAKKHASNASYNDSDPLDTQMGMYVFYQPLFDLALRSWYTNVFMERGSDIVRAPDVTFDKSVVGYQTYVVTDQDREGDDCKTWRAALEVERKAREARGKTLEDEILSFNATGTMTISTNSEPYVPPPKPQPSTVVEFIDAHTIRISRKAKACADGWAAMFVPPEWSMDMCNCSH